MLLEAEQADPRRGTISTVIVRRDPDRDTAGEPGTGPVAIIADGGTTTPSPSAAPTRGASGDQHEDAR